MIIVGFPSTSTGTGGGGGGGSGLVVSASPSTLSKFGSSSSLTTSTTTANASGGTAPYTYAWTNDSAGAVITNNPTSAATSFTATGLASGHFRTATGTITVTDNVGATATDTVDLQFERTGA